MDRREFIITLVACAGCRSPNRSSGDFAQFFVSEVRAHGGRTLDLDTLPVIEGRWRVERDDSGFTVHLFGVPFEKIDSFMIHVLGEPKIATEKNLNCYPQRMYDRKISDMHIQLVATKGEALIVAVGPKKKAA
jgi:hypothetical protein